MCPIIKHTKSMKAGSDDLSFTAGSIASNQAGKPPKSHSAERSKKYPDIKHIINISKRFPDKLMQQKMEKVK